MNELLDAMIAEANHLGCCSTELDRKMADSLRRIVQQTRSNMACSARLRAEADIERFEEIFPFGPENS